MRNFYLPIILFFLLTGKLFSQTIVIAGPTNVKPLERDIYIPWFDYGFSNITWSVVGGTILNHVDNPPNPLCVVKWDNSVGQGSITAYDADNNVTTTLTVWRTQESCAIANAGNDVTICTGNSTTIGGVPAVAGYTYSWSPTTGLSNSNIAQPIASPTTTTTYTLLATPTSMNLITNGGFEGAGGFLSDYGGYPNGDGLCNIPNSPYGSLAITTNPQSLASDWCNRSDHSSVGTRMLAVDGSCNPARRAWYQTTPVTANTTYYFSGWASSLTNFNTPSLNFSINGAVVQTFPVPYSCTGWSFFTITWNSSASTSALIEIRSTSNESLGNDFALDDLAFRTCPTKVDDMTVFVNSGNPMLSPAGPITYYNQYESLTNVVLTSTPASSYQWYKNNVAISGATNQTYAPTYSGLVTLTDYYKVVTSCGNSNTVTFNYIGCDSPSDYPVSIPTNPCASTFPLTLTSPNLGSGTIYSWWASSNPSDFSFSNFNANTCQLNLTGPYSGPWFGDWIYTKSAKNGQETYMFYGVAVANCRPANSVNTNPIVTNSQASISTPDIRPVVENARLVPNPANSQVTINGPSGIENVEIYNMSGVMIKQLKTNRSKSFIVKTHDLVSGLYTCKVVTVAGTEYLKLLIQR